MTKEDNTCWRPVWYKHYGWMSVHGDPRDPRVHSQSLAKKDCEEACERYRKEAHMDDTGLNLCKG